MNPTDAASSPSRVPKHDRRQRQAGDPQGRTAGRETHVEPNRNEPAAPAHPSGQLNGSTDAPPLVHREYSQNLDRTLTRSVSINLKREVSCGPIYQPGESPQGAAANFKFEAAQMARNEPRDPAIDAALTLSDCFLRRESSLENLGLLNRENSLGQKRTNGGEWAGPKEVSVMPPPNNDPHKDLPPPPSTQRQSSLHSLASIAELTSVGDKNRSIFGDEVTDAVQPLERNLSLVFQQQDSARDLLASTVADDSSDEDDSGDDAEPKEKPAYKPQNSYEFFAQNTPQQVFGSNNRQDEEGGDMFAPSFSDLAAVCLNQDRRGSNGTKGVASPATQSRGWSSPTAGGPVASPMNVHQAQNSSEQPQVKYIGKLTVEERRKRVQRYLDKKKRRVWGRKVEYQCRKNLASKRARVHGRFA